jgi:hypothetical protein
MQRAEAALAALQASIGPSQERANEAVRMAQRLGELETHNGDLAEQLDHQRERCRGLEANIKYV